MYYKYFSIIICGTMLVIVLATTQGCNGGGGSHSSTTNPSSVTLTPRTASVEAKGHVLFKIVATGAAAGGEMHLVVEEPGGGTIVGTTYRAPRTPGVYHVRLTSTVDASLADRGEITVGPQIQPNGKLTFFLSQANIPILAGSIRPILGYSLTGVLGGIDFTVVEPEGGAVHASPGTSGVSYAYHAPATPGIYHIKCSAREDADIQCVKAVTVVAP